MAAECSRIIAIRDFKKMKRIFIKSARVVGTTATIVVVNRRSAKREAHSEPGFGRAQLLDTPFFAAILPRSGSRAFPDAQLCANVFRGWQTEFEFMKRQYQPSKIRRKRQHGFLNRNSSKSGKATLRNRRRVGRKRLTPV